MIKKIISYLSTDLVAALTSLDMYDFSHVSRFVLNKYIYVRGVNMPIGPVIN